MTSTASTASSTPTPDAEPAATREPAAPAATAPATGPEHDPGDATVTEAPVESRFTDRAAARAAQSGTAGAVPAPAATEAPGTAGRAGTTEPDQPAAPTRRERRSPDLRAGARRAASVTKTGVNRLRTLLGQVVWIGCLLAAAALLVGVALVVLEANTRNALVEAVLKAADWADLGVFSRTAGIKQFTGENAVVKNACVNWGIGAVAWLVVGRIARRILTP